MSDSPAGRKSVNTTVAYRWPVSHLQRSSSAVRVPIASATPGWGLTAISQGLELREGAADDAALLIPQVRNPPSEFLTARIPEGIRFAAALGEGMTDDAALLIPQVRNPPSEFLTARIPEGIRFAAALGEWMTSLVGSVSRPAAATVAAVRHLGVPGSARADPGTAKRAR